MTRNITLKHMCQSKCASMNECGKMEPNCSTTNVYCTSLIMHYHFILSCVWVNKSVATLKSESASEYVTVIIIAWYIVDTS